jgi:hypothetical protein
LTRLVRAGAQCDMRPSQRFSGALCTALLLGGIQGCTAEEAPTSSVAENENAGSGAAASSDPRNPPPPPSAVPNSGEQGTVACVARERHVAEEIEFRMQQAVDAVMDSESGISLAAGRRIAAVTDRIETTVLRRCDRLSPAMRTFVRVARRESSDGLTSIDLDVVLAAYSGWGRSVGTPSVTSVKKALRDCRRLKQRIRASYRTWWRWTDTGREWWIELTVHNGLHRSWTATLFGRARVTDPAGPAVPSTNQDIDATLVEWGASSRDYATVPPGTSRHLIALSDHAYLATGPSGTLQVDDAGVSMRAGVRAWWCELPVPESS